MISKELFEATLTNPIAFWGAKTKEEIEELLGAAVARMVGFIQNNPHHCYDLYLHTLHTVEQIPESAPVLLRTAAFFHDIGKPDVVKNKNGRDVFYGHPGKSAEIIEELLIKMRYSSEEIAEIVFYISHHDDFISWVLPEEMAAGVERKEISVENLESHIDRYERKQESKKWAADLNCWEHLLELCFADISSQSEEVIVEGELVDSKVHKQQKIMALQKCLKVIREK